MRTAPLTVVKGGIDRGRPKGGVRADVLYDLTNAFITEEFKVGPREGTRRFDELPSGTVGLTAFQDKFHVFSSEPVDLSIVLAQWSVTVANLGLGAFGESNTPDVIVAGPLAPPQGIWNDTGANLMAFNYTDAGDRAAFRAAYGGLTCTIDSGAGGDVVFQVDDFADFGGTALSVLESQGDPALAVIWNADDVGFTRLVTFMGPNPDFQLNILLHPFDQTATLVEVHFAEPFLGALYVVAEFDDGQIYHYWLQEGETWEECHEYDANAFVQPTTPNGYVYRALRLTQPFPAWTPGAPRTAGNGSSIEPSIIEPTVYNEYYYTVIETQGDNPSSGSVEPIWPTATGATIVENTDGFAAPTANEGNPPLPPPPNTPQGSTTDRYDR